MFRHLRDAAKQRKKDAEKLAQAMQREATRTGGPKSEICMLAKVNIETLAIMQMARYGRITVDSARLLSGTAGVANDLADMVEKDIGEKTSSRVDRLCERYTGLRLAAHQEHLVITETTSILTASLKVYKETKKIPVSPVIERKIDARSARALLAGESWRQVVWIQKTNRKFKEDMVKLKSAASCILDRGVTPAGRWPELGDILWARWLLGRPCPSSDPVAERSSDLDEELYKQWQRAHHEFVKEVEAATNSEDWRSQYDTPTRGVKRKSHGSGEAKKRRKCLEDGFDENTGARGSTDKLPCREGADISPSTPAVVKDQRVAKDEFKMAPFK